MINRIFLLCSGIYLIAWGFWIKNKHPKILLKRRKELELERDKVFRKSKNIGIFMISLGIFEFVILILLLWITR